MSAVAAAPAADELTDARRRLAAGLRRRCIQLDRQRGLSPRQRLRRQAMIVLRPATAALRAFQGVRGHGALAARHGGPGRARQLAQLWKAFYHAALTPDEFYRYRLFLGDAEALTPLFISERTNMVFREHVCARLGIDSWALADKRRFHLRCMEAGLPAPPTLAEFEGGEVRWHSPERERSLPQADVFTKRADRLCGEGAARWEWIERGAWRGGGREYAPRELIEHLRQLSREGAYLLQPRLRNHASIASLSPGGLCTVRCVTCRRPGGEPEHLRSLFRMPTGDAAADNFAAGGLAATVDERTGELSSAVRKAVEDAVAGRRFERHPDTGQRIEGFRLEQFDEVKRLCLRAHQVFREFPSVGWDVALTEQGPVLLEGNYNWDVILAQQPGRAPLGATRLLEYLVEFLEAPDSAEAPEAHQREHVI